ADALPFHSAPDGLTLNLWTLHVLRFRSVDAKGKTTRRSFRLRPSQTKLHLSLWVRLPMLLSWRWRLAVRRRYSC
ncbi:hypothetical protein, partial [Pseudomonas viridiflava]|uniref:hypothetical protein n=1 Tax=Pseudomonas viridiflava TaxID=33069 RepID=UPI00197F3969